MVVINLKDWFVDFSIAYMVVFIVLALGIVVWYLFLDPDRNKGW